MQLVNLKIQRIIIHQVYERNDDGTVREPLQNHQYTLFDKEAMDAFRERVKDALGEGSKAVHMEIVNQSSTGLSALVDTMVNQNDEDFSVSSYDIARKLADAQHRRKIPGGIVVIFQGTSGPDEKIFMGIIKAGIYNAYQKRINDLTNEISLEYVEDILLTPTSRLYKTAAFFERADAPLESEDLNRKWLVMVSDYQINPTEGKAAAQYFYSTFLGFGYPETSARSTRKFYEATASFIDALDISVEKKGDLLNALTTYIKTDQRAVIDPLEFSKNYLDIDVRDNYEEHLELEFRV